MNTASPHPTMAPPPADSDHHAPFDKHGSHRSRAARPALRGRDSRASGDDESRRNNWMIAGVLAVTLAVGAWLVFSGLN